MADPQAVRARGASDGVSTSVILANTGFRAVADVGSKIASIALYVVMARELGQASFGVFMYGLAFVTIVTTLANFGQQQVLVREVARDKARVHAYFFNTLALQAVLAVPALALALGIQALLGSDEATQLTVLLLGVAVLAEALMATCFAVFQAYERLGFMAIVVIAQRWTTAVGGIVALSLGADVRVVAAIYLGGAVGALALSLLFVAGRVVRPRREIRPRRWPALMRAALPIGLAGVFGTLLFRADMAMLGWFQSDAEVGLYAAAYRLLESTLFIAWSIGTAFYPVFSRLSPLSEPTIGQLFEGALKLALALALPLAAGALLLAAPLLGLLYGQDFEAAAAALRLLAATFVAFPVTYLASYVLISQGRQAVIAWVLGLVALQNVLFNLVLIPRLSLEGAALGTTISEVLAAVAVLTLALRTCGRIDARRVLAGPVLATAVAALPMVALGESMLAAAIGLAIAGFLITLILYERRAYPADYARIETFLRSRRRGSAPPAPNP